MKLLLRIIVVMTIYADGGTDILVGGDGNDVFNLENVVGGNMFIL